MTDFDMQAFAQEVHANAVAKGFWPEGGRPWGETISLIHSELSEALEEHRARRPRLWHAKEWRDRYGFEGKGCHEGLPTDGGKPEGWAVELADAAIRIIDTLAYEGLDCRPDDDQIYIDGLPERIAHAHCRISEAWAHGMSDDGLYLRLALSICLDTIGPDWPEILRAKHGYNLGREPLHGKAY